MMVRFVSVLALLVTAPVILAADPGQSDPYTRDLLILVDWFEGEFDNEEQRWFQADPRSKTPESNKHERIHTLHRRIDLPEFGRHVFYVEEYKDNDPDQVIRQRFVIFSSKPDAPGIRMQQGFFREPKRFLGGYDRAEVFDTLKSADVFFLDECDVYWRRVAGQFEGRMTAKACVFGEGAERRYSVHNLYLSADKYWRVDSTFLVADDSLHVGFPVDRPYELRRAKRFTCEMHFRPRTAGIQVVDGLSLHSQGGSFDVVRESDGQAFTVLMRDKEYPYYANRPDFLYFSIRRQGERASVAFTVNDSHSRVVGVNIPELLAHCYLEGFEFRESLEQLQTSSN